MLRHDFSIKQKGFTLIELMITVAILGILSAMAAPSFSDFIERQKIKSNVTKLSQMFSAARSEAIVNSAGTVLVCWNPGNADVAVNATTITPNTMMYMVDEDGDLTTAQVIYGETELVADRLSVTDNQANGGIGDNCVSYTSLGRLDDSSNTILGFTYCRDSLQSDGNAGNDEDDSFRIEIPPSGRPTIKDNSTDTTGLNIQNC